MSGQPIVPAWAATSPRGIGADPSPTTITKLDDGFNIPDAKRERYRSLDDRCVYPINKPCEGYMRYPPGSNRPRFCQRPPDDDQGTTALIPRHLNFELTLIQDSVANKQGFVELGRSCADVCKTLGRGLEGRELDDLSDPLMEAIGGLTT